MPLKFIITVDASKGVRVETPPSVATPGEIDIGLKLKVGLTKMLNELLETKAKPTEWKSPNNENRGDN